MEAIEIALLPFKFIIILIEYALDHPARQRDADRRADEQAAAYAVILHADPSEIVR